MANDTKYSPDSERRWQDYWAEHSIYRFDPDTTLPIYSIDTPPPTVSGEIHIGHILSYTQAEVFARFKRMSGYHLFYPFGFDDNGLPTERLVEKEIGKKAMEMDRSDFNAECLKTTGFYREKFKKLWESMGFSVDWDLAYSTISPEVQKASQKSFLKLIERGIIYQKQSPALWCPECQTAVAQAEVEDKELDSVFYDITFTLENGRPVTIATTRPELLPACVGVFVNPDDERFQDLVGKEIITALGKKVRIYTDAKVNPEKGSGVVMCCSYGDETDIHWIKTYGLDECIILSRQGRIEGSGIESIEGLSIHKARKAIIELLKSQGKVTAEKQIRHDVGVHERCSTPMEIITQEQWFIRIIDIKETLVRLGDEIGWHPAHMKKRYSEWVENLKWDWCISRQRYFGIPIPVWKSRKTGEIILPDISQLPIDPLKDRPLHLPADHTYDDIIPETEVLDTWATSSLTPLINAKFFESANLNRIIQPMDLRPQAHDIIRTWALYTIIMGYYHTGGAPFKDILISGHVLASKGQKISKSKSNASNTPAELIRKYGADPIRYWACSCSLGKDVVFDEKEIENGRRLVTKLWNASRFVAMNLGDFDPDGAYELSDLEPIDRWVIARIAEVGGRMRECFESYESGKAILEFERFFWSDFCDNYLEIVKEKVYKPERYADGDRKKRSAQIGLHRVLFEILKLIAPLLPHITEELFQTYYRGWSDQVSIHTERYPQGLDKGLEASFEDLDQKVQTLLHFIDIMRKHKADHRIRLGQDVEMLTIIGNATEIEHLRGFEDDLRSVSKALALQFNIGEELSCEMVQTQAE